MANSDWTACNAASVRANGESRDANDCDDDGDVDGGSANGDNGDGDDKGDDDEDTAVCVETFADAAESSADVSLAKEEAEE